MYFLGHLGLGYLSADIVRRFSEENFFVPLVCLFSLLPNVDILIPSLPHRGPSHSIVIPLMLILPLLLWFRPGLPYLAAFLSHSLIGDLFTGFKGSAMGMYLWPLSQQLMDLGISLDMSSKVEMFIELALFGLMILLIFYEKIVRARRLLAHG